MQQVTMFFFNNKLEKKVRQMLLEIGVIFTEQKIIKRIAVPDFFIEPNICIFADGNYWHDYPTGTDKDFRQNEWLRKNGYKVIRVWESDVNTSPIIVKENIIKELEIIYEVDNNK